MSRIRVPAEVVLQPPGFPITGQGGAGQYFPTRVADDVALSSISVAPATAPLIFVKFPSDCIGLTVRVFETLQAKEPILSTTVPESRSVVLSSIFADSQFPSRRVGFLTLGTDELYDSYQLSWQLPDFMESCGPPDTDQFTFIGSATRVKTTPDGTKVTTDQLSKRAIVTLSSIPLTDQRLPWQWLVRCAVVNRDIPSTNANRAFLQMLLES